MCGIYTQYWYVHFGCISNKKVATFGYCPLLDIMPAICMSHYSNLNSGDKLPFCLFTASLNLRSFNLLLPCFTLTLNKILIERVPVLYLL